MIIQIHASLPISEAQGVKESVAMRLEDMAQVVKVVNVLDDGYGQQQAIQENPVAAARAEKGDSKDRRIKYLETMLQLYDTGALKDWNNDSPAFRDELKYLREGV